MNYGYPGQQGGGQGQGQGQYHGQGQYQGEGQFPPPQFPPPQGYYSAGQYGSVPPPQGHHLPPSQGHGGHLPPSQGYGGHGYPTAPPSYGSPPPPQPPGRPYHNIQGAPLPPQAPQHFGNGAPSDYTFQYSACSGRRKALLIGINYFGQQGELKGCINDTRNLSAFLIERFGYKREDMVILTDDQRDPRMQPTRENMLRAMNWLVGGAQPHDALFFHYSGAYVHNLLIRGPH